MTRHRLRSALWLVPLVGLGLVSRPGALLGAAEDPCSGCEEFVRKTLTELQARGWWGAAFTLCPPGTPGVAANGLLVLDVTPQGPADAVGLEKGDVVVSIDGSPLGDLDATAADGLLAEIRPGDRLDLTVDRRGRRLDLEMQAGRMPYLELAKALGNRLMTRYAPSRAPQIVGDPPSSVRRPP